MPLAASSVRGIQYGMPVTGFCDVDGFAFITGKIALRRHVVL